MNDTNGLTIPRHFTTEGVHPYETVMWERRDAIIMGENGQAVFEQRGVEFPVSWSQLATNVVASKYFRGQMTSPERECSVQQIINRVVLTIMRWGVEGGYFATEGDARVFEDELTHILLYQMASFNSPVWFNIGTDRPQQASACFILGVEDSMESIFEWYKEEGMIFKGGSGSGVNLSKIRGVNEQLSGGGMASGPLSFMRAADVSAGAIKSAGATRRSAKMVILNIDHPDIEAFIKCKMIEEKKAHVLIDAGYDASLDGEAYASVFFQNANNSIRVPDAFMQAVLDDAMVATRFVTTGQICKEYRARDLFRLIAEAAHACGDPGLQFDTTINAWHTCANTDRIHASNPCQPKWAHLLTPDGIRTMGEVEIGDTIWSGSQWTTITNKWCTGTKPVFGYHTRAGVFYGTSEHKVISGGQRSPVGRAQSIDIAIGPQSEKPDHLRQAIVDGLVIGDGATHISNQGRHAKTFLCIGDGEESIYRNSEIGSFIGEYRPGYSQFYYEVSTTITRLPKTWRRRVPRKYRHGSQEEMTSFLRGLYSANGSICGGRITLKAASKQMILDVQMMLSALGIGSYYTVNKSKSIQWDNGEYASKESYDLNITIDRRIFVRLIGFIHPEKMERAMKACAMRPSMKPRKLSYDIVEIEEFGEQDVWDITVENEEHTYWTGGLLVSNCSEYVFLDNSACNLASINLMKFLCDDGTFDIDGYRHTVDMLITAQEILVDNAAYPTPAIAQNSHDYRPLGLGYANLGALLMAQGLAYDSDAGRAYAAAVTALMTGQAYATSAKIAAITGPFRGYAKNREPMLGVIRKHRESTVHIQSALVPYDLMGAARRAWDDALRLGEEHGYRNAQATLLAPTGTISFMMDCDTTGVEPDIALVKYKKLVGGGTIKMVNETIPHALAHLGYAPNQISDILGYIDTHDTIEGAPCLREEHLSIFDCAFAPKNGIRSIHYTGHIRMIGSVQPFLSGAISKTTNLPTDATIEDIEHAFILGWQVGAKAIAIYRDGCKRTQPLNTHNTVTALLPETQTPTPARRRLPDERPAITHKFSIAGHEGYATVGMFEDGSPGELFLVMAKEGSTISGLMDAFATSISLALQYGVPLMALIDKFTHMRFEPAGFTKNPQIPIAKSIMDYLFRWLASKFLRAEEQVSVGVIGVIDSTADTTTPKVEGPTTLFRLQEDAPFCLECGEQMIRSGSCYKCLNCGATSGCS